MFDHGTRNVHGINALNARDEVTGEFTTATLETLLRILDIQLQ